ncbi:MAG: TraB/GumN family protein [Bacteroidetes bacterium]|nr:TraB/GumN family protein [Bacteroidota bacterium]
MKKLSLLLFIHLFVSAINAQVKQGNSLFWEISGNGLSKPSYLYGTMHVSSKTAFHLTDSFFVALKNVDMVALESRPEEWIDGLFNSDLMSSAYSQGGVYTKAYSNEDNDYSLYNIGFSNYIPKRQDLGSILSIEPSLINGILFRTQQVRQDFQEDTYLDMFIYQCGKKLGKGTIGLETFTVA